tara:strand:+ start:306 stop:734 length:429 start_codon:yes stop_codon:yes gene_type:complete
MSPLLLSCSKYSDDATSSVTSTETGITYDSSTATLTIPLSSTQGTTLQSPGGFVTINSVDTANVNVMLGNIDGTVVAFSSVCPHANANNRWSLTNNQFICGSHNSIFDSNGEFSNQSSTNGVNDLSEYSVNQSSEHFQVSLS